MYRKVDAWCNDPSGEPRDLLEVVQRFHNDEGTQPGIDRISHGEHRAYRKRILYYNNDMRLVFWRTPLAYAGRYVVSALSYRTCSRNTRVHNRMFPCVSINVKMFLQVCNKKKFKQGTRPW